MTERLKGAANLRDLDAYLRTRYAVQQRIANPAGDERRKRTDLLKYVELVEEIQGDFEHIKEILRPFAQLDATNPPKGFDGDKWCDMIARAREVVGGET